MVTFVLHRFFFLIFSTFAYLVPVILATVFTDPAQLVKKEYDFVVVGGGTAGNVLANRLTNGTNFTVLVIEAGITNDGFLPSIVPFLAPSMTPFSSVTWNFSTVPQASLGNRTLTYPRGRMLGGSSSINFMTYTRGSDEEYDRWANLTGDSGWEWKNLAPYYFKSSRLVPPADNHNTTGQVDPSAHGDGPVEISLPGFPTELDPRVINATEKFTSEFPFNLDLQSGDSVGIGFVQSTIGNGERSSSATAYLDPVLSRSNLDVLIQTQVTKVISHGKTSQGKPKFEQVEFAISSDASRYTVTANKEIILSAGSIGSPQILLLSGIGNSTTLSDMGIEPIVDLPDVGQHLQDHPIMANYFVLNSNQSFDNALRNTNISATDLELWQTNRSGLFADAPVNTMGFLRLPSNASIFENVTDPSAGPKSGHFEWLFVDGFITAVQTLPDTGNFMTVEMAVVSPLSHGSVTLNSTDPFDNPIIDPNFFSDPFDQYTMVEAVKSLRRFLEAPEWNDFILGRYGFVGDANTDEEILEAAKKAIVTIWHPTSTARMSPENASWGVVDPNLRVKGTFGLRVVDASVFPRIPSAHTVAPVYIVAERAADLILSEWC